MAGGLFNIIANLVTRLDADPKGFIDEMKKTFDDATNIVTSFASAGAAAIKGTFKESNLGNFISELGDITGLSEALSAPLDSAKSAVATISDFVAKEFKAAWDSPIDYASGRISAFGESAKTVFNDTFNETSFSKFAQGVYDIFDRLPDLFSSIREGDFSAAFEGIKEEVGNLLSSFDDPNAAENSMFSRLRVGAEDFKKALSNLGRSALNEMGVLEQVDSMMGQVGDSWKKVIDPDVGPITNISNLLEDVVSTAGEQFAGQIDKMAAGEGAASTVAQYLRGIINAGKDLYTALRPAYDIMNVASGALQDVGAAAANTAKELVKTPGLVSKLRVGFSGLVDVAGNALGGAFEIAKAGLSGLGTLLGTTTGLVLAGVAGFVVFAATMVASFAAGVAQASALNEAMRNLDGTLESLGSDGGSVDSVRSKIQTWSNVSSASIAQIAKEYQNLLTLFGDSATPDAIVELASRISATDANKNLNEMTQLIAKLAGGSNLSAQEMRRLGITFEDLAAAGFDSTKVIENLTAQYGDYADRLDDVNTVSRAMGEFATESEKLFGPLVEVVRQAGILIGSVIVDAGTLLVKATNTLVTPVVGTLKLAASGVGEIVSALGGMVGDMVDYISSSSVYKATADFAGWVKDGIGGALDSLQEQVDNSVIIGTLREFWDAINTDAEEGSEKLAEQILKENAAAAQSSEQRRATRRRALEDQAKYNTSAISLQESYVNNFIRNIHKSGQALDEDIKFMRDYYARRNSMIAAEEQALTAQEARYGEVRVAERIRLNNLALEEARASYERELSLARQVAEQRADISALPAAEREAQIKRILAEDTNLHNQRQNLQSLADQTAIKNRRAFYDAIAQEEEIAAVRLSAASAFRPPSTEALEDHYAKRKVLALAQIQLAKENTLEYEKQTAAYIQLLAEEEKALRDNIANRAQITGRVQIAEASAEEALSGRIVDLAAEQYRVRKDALDKSLVASENFAEEYVSLAADAYQTAIAEVNRARDAHISAYSSMLTTSQAYYDFERSVQGDNSAALIAQLERRAELQARMVETSRGNAQAERDALLAQVSISRERYDAMVTAASRLVAMQTTINQQTEEIGNIIAATSIARETLRIETLRKEYELAETQVSLSRKTGEERLRLEQDLNKQRLAIIEAGMNQADDLLNRALSGEFSVEAVARSKAALSVLQKRIDAIRKQAEEGAYATTQEAAEELGAVFAPGGGFASLAQQLTRSDREMLTKSFQEIQRTITGDEELFERAKDSVAEQQETLGDTTSQLGSLAEEQGKLIDTTNALRDTFVEFDTYLRDLTGLNLIRAQLDAAGSAETLNRAVERREDSPESGSSNAMIFTAEQLRTLAEGSRARPESEVLELLKLVEQQYQRPEPPTPPPATAAKPAPAPTPAPPAPPAKPEPPRLPDEIIPPNPVPPSDTPKKDVGGNVIAALARGLDRVATALEKLGGLDIFTPELLERIMLGLSVELEKEVRT